jgi:hypothetical protein
MSCLFIVTSDAVRIAVFHFEDLVVVQFEGAGDEIDGVGVLDALRGYKLKHFPVTVALARHLTAGDG